MFLFIEINIFFLLHILHIIHIYIICENMQNNFWNYLLLYYVSYHFLFCYSLSFRLETFLRYLGNIKWVNVKVAQSSPTLCNPMDYTVHGILHARILGWIAIPFFGGSSQPRNQTRVSCIAGRFITKWATREALRQYTYRKLRMSCFLKEKVYWKISTLWQSLLIHRPPSE